MRPGRRVRMSRRSGVVDRDVRRLDPQSPARRHGVAAVDDEVHQHLADLARIRLDESQRRLERRRQLDVLADEPAQHPGDVLDHLVHVQDPGLDDLLPAERQQLLREIGRLPAGVRDLAHLRPLVVGQAVVGLQHVGVAVDHREQVVEIVRHTARKPADSLNPLRLLQLLGEPRTLGLGEPRAVALVADPQGEPAGQEQQRQRAGRDEREIPLAPPGLDERGALFDAAGGDGGPPAHEQGQRAIVRHVRDGVAQFVGDAGRGEGRPDAQLRARGRHGDGPQPHAGAVRAVHEGRDHREFVHVDGVDSTAAHPLDQRVGIFHDGQLRPGERGADQAFGQRQAVVGDRRAVEVLLPGEGPLGAHDQAGFALAVRLGEVQEGLPLFTDRHDRPQIHAARAQRPFGALRLIHPSQPDARPPGGLVEDINRQTHRISLGIRKVKRRIVLEPNRVHACVDDRAAHDPDPGHDAQDHQAADGEERRTSHAGGLRRISSAGAGSCRDSP